MVMSKIFPTYLFFIYVFLFKLDLASSMTIDVSQGFSICDLTYEEMHLESIKVEEGDMKVKKQANTLTSFPDYKSNRIINSTVPENSKELLLRFDDVKNGKDSHTNT